MPYTYFTIVGLNDASIFEFGQTSESESLQLSRQFMMHSALDLVEENMWARGDLYLPKVDHPADDQNYVSAYVGLAPVKLLLMQDSEPYDNVRPFFSEVYELCVQYLLSPFADPAKPIRSKEFDSRFHAVYSRYF